MTKSIVDDELLMFKFPKDIVCLAHCQPFLLWTTSHFNVYATAFMLLLVNTVPTLCKH